MKTATLATLALLLACTLPTAAQEEELVTIALDKDLAIADLLDRIGREIGKPLLYDPNGQRIARQVVGAAITRTVPKDRLLDAYRAILAFHELVLVPVGPAGYETILVLDTRSTNNIVKNKAIPVAYENLAAYRDRDGLYIMTLIPVRHLDNLTTLRTALATMVSPAGLGRVHEVPDGSGLVVMDFAPVAAAIGDVVRTMDAEAEGKQRVMVSIELRHAYAPAMAETVRALVDIGQAQDPRRPAPPPGPRIVAYAPRNALAVSATAAEVELIRGLVASLDQPVEGQREVQVVRLEHALAREVAKVLTGIVRTTPPGRVQAEIAADTTTNSVVLAADGDTLAALRVVLDLLDKPRQAEPAGD